MAPATRDKIHGEFYCSECFQRRLKRRKVKLRARHLAKRLLVLMVLGALLLLVFYLVDEYRFRPW